MTCKGYFQYLVLARYLQSNLYFGVDRYTIHTYEVAILTCELYMNNVLINMLVKGSQSHPP